MKLEGSIQEIKEFIKEFQSKDTAFSKQQLKQIEEVSQKISEKSKKDLSNEVLQEINEKMKEKCW